MALLPTRFQSLAEPRYGERMMYDGAPIMDGGYGLLGGDIMAPAAAQQPLPTAQPMTQEVAPFDLSSLAGLDLSGLNSLYGMNFGSDFGGGAMGGIYPDNPNLQYINAPISNKGNPTSPSGNVFTMTPDQKVRLVDLRTNEVVFEGTGYDAAREATRLGQNLTDTLGRKAEYNIQTANPAGEYTTVANEKKNKSTLGAIADVALPVIGTIVAGPLGAAAGSAASSVAQGRSLENTLLRAGLSAGTTALGGQVFGPASSAAGSAAGSTVGSAAGGAAGAAAGTTAGSAIGSAAGDIIVNAARSVAPSLLGSAAGSAVGSVIPSLINAPSSTPSSTPTEQPMPEEIVVTGSQPPALDLSGVIGALPLAPTIPSPTPMPEEIVVTGQRPTTPPPIPGIETVIPAITGGALTPAQTAGTPPPAENGGVLGTGLTLPQLLSIGGVGADLLKNLLAGGTDTGTGAPYVSPFGTGVGFAPGQDMRANPNIIDYERYGFGPEAMFFQPGYGLLNSAAPAPQAPPIMATNPRYEPLI